MPTDVTRLLADVAAGRPGAFDELYPLVYRELRAMAGRLLRGERRDHSLQATALVHEAYVRLVRTDDPAGENRTHFMALAARVMRCVLCDHARRRRRHKRGGGRGRVPLESAILPTPEAEGVDLVELDDALQRLRDIHARAVMVVEMRYFGGLTMEEIGTALNVSLTTVEREWRYARAWLAKALGAANGETSTES